MVLFNRTGVNNGKGGNLVKMSEVRVGMVVYDSPGHILQITRVERLSRQIRITWSCTGCKSGSMSYGPNDSFETHFGSNFCDNIEELKAKYL